MLIMQKMRFFQDLESFANIGDLYVLQTEENEKKILNNIINVTFEGLSILTPAR